MRTDELKERLKWMAAGALAVILALGLLWMANQLLWWAAYRGMTL